MIVSALEWLWSLGWFLVDVWAVGFVITMGIVADIDDLELDGAGEFTVLMLGLAIWPLWFFLLTCYGLSWCTSRYPTKLVRRYLEYRREPDEVARRLRREED